MNDIFNQYLGQQVGSLSRQQDPRANAGLANQQSQQLQGLATQQSLMNSLLGSGMAAYTVAQAQPFTPFVEPLGVVLLRFNDAVDALEEARQRVRMVYLRGNLPPR